MILKEIEMDLPYPISTYNAKESSSLESIKADYETNWKALRRQFQLETRCMTSMIERIIPRIKTDDCWKILIECVSTLPKEKCTNLLGVYCVQISFDVNDYWGMDSTKKKQYVVSKILEAIDKISECTDICLTQIVEACHTISELSYVNSWLWKSPIKGKYGYVQIKLVHDIEAIDIYMIFLDRNKRVFSQKLLVSTPPHEMVYSKYLGKLEWIAEDAAKLTTKYGDSFVGSPK